MNQMKHMENGRMGRLAEGLHWRKEVLVNGLARQGEALQTKGWGRTWLERRWIDMLLLPADIRAMRGSYRRQFGVPPRLLRPRTFNEKIQHFKLFSRRERYVRYADKLRVRDFVRERVGEQVLNPLYWSGTDLMDARMTDLPEQFIIKTNHGGGGGGNLVVRSRDELDWEEVARSASAWLHNRYGGYASEWQYRWIEPRLLIERLLEGPGGGAPIDCKFYCFYGRVEFLQMDFDRYVRHTRVLFDREFNRLPVAYEFPLYDGTVFKPRGFEQMIQIAERLAKDEPSMRVDLYEGEPPVFGELTLTPEGGIGVFSPPEWDLQFGMYW